MGKSSGFFICPYCGSVVANNALSCPGCGSDKETGWNEEWGDQEPAITAMKKKRPWVRYITLGLTMLLVSALCVSLLSWGIYLVPAVLILFAGIFYFTQIYPQRPAQAEKRQEKELENQLLYMVNGDAEKANRLVFREQIQRPTLTRKELLQYAIFRLYRDRR